MQSVSAEAKATLSESQPHPSSSLSVWALFPPAGLERYCTAAEDSGSSLAQPACCGYLLLATGTSLDSDCF